MTVTPPGWLPPEEYVETIARATSYACLYFTDTRGRPVQLRATYGAEVWQWPGGNMDRWESPWECAVRECLEETGIIFEGEQKLLASHFIGHRGREWPANRIGFCFDGGTLCDEQIESIVLDPREHTEVQVHTMAGWARMMTARDFALLEAVDTARRTGTVTYLEG
ncbi:NUDIX domain-containing protein [Streptomyces sp. NBC_00539]|uniref:NUDIX domain-containing protein n=1 Tax=Streptomyces sp. NBC_00539 TaxID=2975770 RepID=UPI002E820B3A|nr:NUDIX domain-containing protein [Streptomyces sp. NBC_00539]WUC64138.1 NUDIX domain-containing protein [Streptomyces sp. NBC_00539]